MSALVPYAYDFDFTNSVVQDHSEPTTVTISSSSVSVTQEGGIGDNTRPGIEHTRSAATFLGLPFWTPDPLASGYGYFRKGYMSFTLPSVTFDGTHFFHVQFGLGGRIGAFLAYYKTSAPAGTQAWNFYQTGGISTSPPFYSPGTYYISWEYVVVSGVDKLRTWMGSSPYSGTMISEITASSSLTTEASDVHFWMRGYNTRGSTMMYPTTVTLNGAHIEYDEYLATVDQSKSSYWNISFPEPSLPPYTDGATVPSGGSGSYPMNLSGSSQGSQSTFAPPGTR